MSSSKEAEKSRFSGSRALSYKSEILLLRKFETTNVGTHTAISTGNIILYGEYILIGAM